MRHRVSGRKLDLPSDQRLALLKSIARSVIMHESIETTEPRAKEARVLVEKLVSLAKQNDVSARREARKLLPPPQVPTGMLSIQGAEQKKQRAARIEQDPVKRLFDVVGPKLADKKSGYTRIIKIGLRRGDAAAVVKLELAVD